MRYTVRMPHRIYSGESTAQWARENCPSYLSATLYIRQENEDTKTEYHFADEKDAMIFSLKWV